MTLSRNLGLQVVLDVTFGRYAFSYGIRLMPFCHHLQPYLPEQHHHSASDNRRHQADVRTTVASATGVRLMRTLCV